MELLSEVRVDGSVSGVSVVSLLGEHDLASADEVRAALQSGLEGSGGMVVDLSQTLFIDSSVIHALYDARRELGERGRQLVLQLQTASVLVRALEVSGLADALPVAHDRDAAIALAREKSA
jgi:anti-anti-sigma factor